MTEYYDENGEWVSKTRRKRECDDLQDLGEQLIELKADELDRFELPDNLRDAINAAKKIHQRGALKRQKQFIGRLMRDVDAEVITQRLEEIRHKDDVNNALFKRIEKWRDRVIEEGDTAINELVEEYPEADRQHLRQLQRNAIQEKQRGKPPVAFRQIFKYIRELADKQI